MTSISSTSSSATSPYLSRLDTNGDGVISVSERATATTSAPKSSSTASLPGRSFDNSSVGNSAADQLSSMMMSMILESGSGESSGSEAAESGTSGGQAGEKTPAQTLVANLDSNGDGVISAAEFIAGEPGGVKASMSAKLFSALDNNRDGSISESDLSAAQDGYTVPAQASAEASVSSSGVLSGNAETSQQALLTKLEEIAQKYLSASGETNTTTPLLTV